MKTQTPQHAPRPATYAHTATNIIDDNWQQQHQPRQQQRRADEQRQRHDQHDHHDHYDNHNRHDHHDHHRMRWWELAQFLLTRGYGHPHPLTDRARISFVEWENANAKKIILIINNNNNNPASDPPTNNSTKYQKLKSYFLGFSRKWPLENLKNVLQSSLQGPFAFQT